MKEIKTKMSFLKKKGNLRDKFNYLMEIIVDMQVRMSDQQAFIESIKLPFVEKFNEFNSEDLNILIDSIFGYFCYLMQYDQNNLNQLFLNYSQHDLRIFLKNGRERLRTKAYKSFLN